MSDEDLIGYLLDALAPDERAEVEQHLRRDTDAIVRLAELRLAFEPLEADREHPSPPQGLAARTLARLAAHLAVPGAEHTQTAHAPAEPVAVARAATATQAISEEPEKTEPLAVPSQAGLPGLPHAPKDEPESRLVGGRLRLDLFVAAGIALFASGILFSAIGKVRAEHQLVACQNSLRTVHTGLTGYADTHSGRFPQIGVGTNATAETFATTLAESGQVPQTFRPCCPAALTLAPDAVGYTYTLGYRSPNGGLQGLRSPGGVYDETELVPIAADFPSADAAPASGPTCPHTQGMNVLFVGGHVRLTTSPLIGPGGDDIFRNVLGQVAAGVDRTDVVLGRPGDRP
jgi:prepilin-type processing-associated H-X9-DG protein